MVYTLTSRACSWHRHAAKVLHNAAREDPHDGGAPARGHRGPVVIYATKQLRPPEQGH
eukprot:CAMPEP_0179242738 /NCGR_PEP_ID=MMETSP0797-20121207/17173_1 /TAXON_ID=47934 /ORGANISM="Dinophysis acuminata, Strain DAEP01" /LENGTH=57 /DNA_ID=CAMNT_0020950185 /DNA_START=19 /DNA_END=192 /DNA_ORIENTATION=-